MSLADRGANGIIGGNDVRVICKHIPERQVDISGVNNHQMTHVPIATVGGVTESNEGPVICIFHETAYTG